MMREQDTKKLKHYWQDRAELFSFPLDFDPAFYLDTVIDLKSMTEILWRYEEERYADIKVYYGNFVIRVFKDEADFSGPMQLFCFILDDEGLERHIITETHEKDKHSDRVVRVVKEEQLPRLVPYVAYLQEYIFETEEIMDEMREEFIKNEEEELIKLIHKRDVR